MMKVNLIYNGDGVAQEFLPFLVKTLQKLGPTQLISPSKLIEGKWLNDAFSLVIPGGRDRPYHRDLKGVGNQWIQTFVKNGGHYIGICAGAYYACSHIEFAKGTDLQIIEDRDLNFFQGKAIGPALGDDFDYHNAGIKLTNIFYQGAICEKGQMYYHGGPTFIGKGDHKVLATYCSANHLPAIILSKFGEGKVLLSGVHFEHPNKDPYQEKIRQNIVSDLLCLLPDRT